MQEQLRFFQQDNIGLASKHCFLWQLHNDFLQDRIFQLKVVLPKNQPQDQESEKTFAEIQQVSLLAYNRHEQKLALLSSSQTGARQRMNENQPLSGLRTQIRLAQYIKAEFIRAQALQNSFIVKASYKRKYNQFRFKNIVGNQRIKAMASARANDFQKGQSISLAQNVQLGLFQGKFEVFYGYGWYQNRRGFLDESSQRGDLRVLNTCAYKYSNIARRLQIALHCEADFKVFDRDLLQQSVSALEFFRTEIDLQWRQQRLWFAYIFGKSNAREGQEALFAWHVKWPQQADFVVQVRHNILSKNSDLSLLYRKHFTERITFSNLVDNHYRYSNVICYRPSPYLRITHSSEVYLSKVLANESDYKIGIGVEIYGDGDAVRK